MQVVLVPAVEQDRSFFRQAHHLAYRGVIEPMFGWDEASQDRFADIDFDARNPHIIQHMGSPVGVIGWQDKDDHLWFGPIFILPAHQNQGIGTFLVKEFIQKAVAQNVALRLQTLRKNENAKRLYEKLGFRTLSSSDVHWQMEYLPG